MIRQYISDPVVLRFLDNFITVLPSGLSKGLRSSQCFANLYLSPVDHVMCCHVPKYIAEDGTVRYLYQRYMDDAAMWCSEKRPLWNLRDIYHAEITKLGLTVKNTEAIRPITEGIDYLGFVSMEHTHDCASVPNKKQPDIWPMSNPENEGKNLLAHSKAWLVMLIVSICFTN